MTDVRLYKKVWLTGLHDNESRHTPLWFKQHIEAQPEEHPRNLGAKGGNLFY